MLKDSDIMLFKSRKAVLIIHGFAGGTYDEEKLANFLELNKNYDVFQFTLPGHRRNFSKVKYEEWIDSSEKQIEWLISKGYRCIYVIGHSMGGVIATYIASKYKEVKKLVLAAPAFHYLSVIKDDVDIKKSIQKAPGLIKTYSGEEIIARLFKLNPGALKEFVDLVKKYYDCPKDVYCPVLIIQGKSDELVPMTSSEYVYNTVGSSNKKLVYVDGLTHDIFRKEREELFNIVRDFLKHGTRGGIENI